MVIRKPGNKKNKPNKNNLDKKLFFYIAPLLIIAAVLFIDQLTKYLLQNRHYYIINGIFELKYSQNTGIVFGWFSNSIIVTMILPFLIAAFFAYMYFREGRKHRLLMIGFPLIVAGLLGNLIDRIVRGFVTDFIFVMIVPSRNISNFNIADASLVSGVALVMIYLIWFEKENKKLKKKKE